MEYFLTVSEQIIIFIIYAMIGVIAVKTKVFNKNSLNVLSTYIVKIGLPMLIFSKTIGTTRSQFIETLPILAATVFMYIVLFFVSWLLASVFKLRGNVRNIYRVCTMFGNGGFIGIPIINALFSDTGVLYIALFTIVDQLLLWTVGVNLAMPVEKNDDTPEITVKMRIKKLINPVTVGLVIAIVIILGNIELPDLLQDALSNTGATATPLAMIYLGGTFCFLNIKDYLKKTEIYVSILVKMILLPIVICNILLLIPGLDDRMSITLGVLCALPTMTSVTMIAESQKSASDYSAGMIFVTTVFSIITIPIVCLIIG